MSTEQNQEVVDTPEVVEGEGDEVQAVDVEKFKELQENFEKLNETVGSLKRENKDLKKAKEEPKGETPKEPQSEEFGLLHRTFLASNGVTEEDEIELAREVQKETGMDWAKLGNDEYFKFKLEQFRKTKVNTKATGGVKGGKVSSDAKQTVDYWLQKGEPPTRDDVPDRKKRAEIARAFVGKAKGGKTFYSD
jgi:hypothetical protein